MYSLFKVADITTIVKVCKERDVREVDRYGNVNLVIELSKTESRFLFWFILPLNSMKKKKKTLMMKERCATDQQNVSQQSRLKQVEEDARVTITPVHETQKADEPVQSSYVSSDFTSKLLNLENPCPTDNEIASLMDTSAHHATVVLKNTSGFTTTIPLPPLFFNPLLTLTTTPTLTLTSSEVTTLCPSLLDFTSVFKFNERVTNSEKDLSEMKEEAQAKKRKYIEVVDSTLRTIIKKEVNTQPPQILPQALSDVATPVIEKNVTESIEAVVLTTSLSQPQSSYEVAAILFGFELTKILIDKMEKNKSSNVAYYKRELYDALVKSYNTNKDIFESHGEVFSLKRSRDERDKDRGTKRRKPSKDFVSSRDSRSKDKKSSSTSKETFETQHKSSGKSAHAEELSHTVEDSGKQQGQEFVTRDNDEQLDDKEGRDLSRKYSTSVTKTKAATYELKWIEDLVLELRSPVQLKYDQHAYLGTSHWVTRLRIMKKYDYCHLEEIEVRRDDQKLYMFKEGDFKRLCLQDIKDLLLLLVQQKLTNLTINEQYDLNVVLRMYTRRMVIQRSNLRKKTTYTSFSDPHRIIYVDQNRRKKLMRADELHKFSDGTLNDVRFALHDIATGIRMENLPMRKWSNLDKKRAPVMVQDIDKQLYQKRLMRNLEKFVGKRVYRNDLRLLERTI
uniref:Uncharacterized protein n=1 Tax=Tanacetum cinerariifolium TaxID=118510 RepID=A0A699HGA6_TANCI|nr:hypothetical protein [Tanacetum cinerariifolium]